ncbi:MAG TPA: carboxypeptidase-like regulatory domain-containing protein, partial [Acidobacteriota bacterium]|nr:carboxypeptidase-like regulatory domain-containing protein [Acidobacteriota bacterium]
DKTSVQVLLLSTGPNRTLDSVSETPGDDFLVWHSQIIYSFQQSAPIHSALKKFILRSGRLPTTEAEFHQALALNGSTLDQFRDPMQHPFRVKFEYRTYDQSGNEVWLPVTTPVDPNLLYRKNADDGHFQISLISDGRDGQPGTEDDFRAFSSSLYEAIYYGKPQISHLAPMKHCMYGMVFDLEGKPLSDVLIVANPGSKNTKVEARSDAQGRFVIPGQSQGLYELRFSPHPKNPQNQLVAAATTPFQTYAGANSEGSGFLQVQLFDPTSPQTKDLKPKQETGMVYGQITDQFTGLPIPLATIEFNNLEQDHKYVTTSNLKGQFALRSVSNGIYSLTALKYGFSQLNIPETPVLADRNTHLPLTLTPDPNAARIPDSNQLQAILKKVTGTGTLSGVVQGNNQAVIPNARVTAVDTHFGLLFAATTDASGRYVFPSLPIGEYQVTVSAKQYYDFTAVEVIIAAQQRVRLDAKLIVNTGDCIAIHHTVARSSPPPDCYWTRPVQAGADGKFRFEEIPSDQLQHWKQVIVVLMKDGSVRWVLR